MEETELVEQTLSNVQKQLSILEADLSELHEMNQPGSPSEQKYGKLEDGLLVCRDLMKEIAAELESGSK